MYRLIDHRPRLDAVFVASDLMAAGAPRALRRLGRRVPDDVAVIGFGDSLVTRHQPPPTAGPVTSAASRAMPCLCGGSGFGETRGSGPDTTVHPN
jgi:DNA-binding LacI/PurR family transcriptional regulator